MLIRLSLSIWPIPLRGRQAASQSITGPEPAGARATNGSLQGVLQAAQLGCGISCLSAPGPRYEFFGVVGPTLVKVSAFPVTVPV